MQVTSREELEVWAEPCAVAAGRDRGDCERAGGGGGRRGSTGSHSLTRGLVQSEQTLHQAVHHQLAHLQQCPHCSLVLRLQQLLQKLLEPLVLLAGAHHSRDLVDPALQSLSLVHSSRGHGEPKLSEHATHQLLKETEVRRGSTQTVPLEYVSTAGRATLMPSSSAILRIILTQISLVRGNWGCSTQMSFRILITLFLTLTPVSWGGGGGGGGGCRSTLDQ